jgi:hypothetical protein
VTELRGSLWVAVEGDGQQEDISVVCEMLYKCAINRVVNPKPVCKSHTSPTRHNIKEDNW